MHHGAAVGEGIFYILTAEILGQKLQQMAFDIHIVLQVSLAKFQANCASATHTKWTW